MMEYYAKKFAPKGYVLRMEHAGFKASLMRAPKLEDRGYAHRLPQGDPIPVFPLAALPGAPEGWVREAGSYVCPVDANWGLWFDWTMNDEMNTAVVPSCKGMNPITGQKLEGLGLEEYSDKCPVHKEPFAHGNYCEKCGYEWPPQNYVCSPNTLWWDGFRQPDGKVRQFFFSEDESKDIASLVIGKENTVPAFGFGFFRPKNPRTAPKMSFRGGDFHSKGFSHHIGGQSLMGCMEEPMGCSIDMASSDDTGPAHVYYASSVCNAAPTASCAPKAGGVIRSRGMPMRMKAASPAPVKAQAVKAVSVGAGAEIAQNLVRDNLGMANWLPEAAGTIRLYFCFQPQFEHIVNNGGVKEFEKSKEGFLKGLPVGG
jgi:hypothetical protein